MPVMYYVSCIFFVVFSAVAKGNVPGDLEENEAFWKRYLQSQASMFPSPTPQVEPSPPPSSRAPVLSPTPIEPTVTPQPNELPCGIPSQLRAELLSEIAEGTSGPIEENSPQDRALNWLINEDDFFVCPDDPKALQRYILAVFYYSTDGDSKFIFLLIIWMSSVASLKY